MKFGVNTFIWTVNFDAKDLPLLPVLKEHGFDGFECAIFDPPTFPATTIRRGCQETGLEVSVCSVIPNGLSIVSDDADIRRKTSTYVIDCVNAIADAGGKLFVGPFYSPVGYLPGRRRTEDEWKRCVEAYQEIGPVCAQHGVTIALEPLNRFETYFLNTAADGVRLCDAVGHPNIGLLIDTFHANIEEKSVANAYRIAARHLKHVHTCENDRGTPGSGHVDWDGVFEALDEIGYDGWLTIESFGFAIKEIAAAACIWRDIEKAPEDIAFEGLRFLRTAHRPERLSA